MDNLPKGWFSQLTERFLLGDEGALARLITLTENGDTRALSFLSELSSKKGNAQVVGITGAPGAGKSSFVVRLAVELSHRGRRCAILSVDPSSPFTGGALLGDRVRMAEIDSDRRTYMRSLSTRGALGGLSAASRRVVDLLDIQGFDVILLETVGAGQSEIEVVRQAHTVVMVAVPGLGDAVQAMKSGIMEIGDIFVVNKSDLPGADRTAAEISALVELGHPGVAGINLWETTSSSNSDQAAREHLWPRYGQVSAGQISWRPPVCNVSALENKGIPEVADLLDRHNVFLQRSGLGQTRRQANSEDGLKMISEALTELLLPSDDNLRRELFSDLIEGRVTPRDAAKTLLSTIIHEENDK